MKFKEAEFWRDIESLSSFTFYMVVVARSLIGLHWPFFLQLTGALALSQVVLRGVGTALKQKISSHAANGGALIILINDFYKSKGFLIFSIVLYLLVAVAHKKIRKHSWTEIITGAIIGLLSALLMLFLI